MQISHPIPNGCQRCGGLADLWAEEMGKLLCKHESVKDGNEFFIGVACENGFAGKPINRYEDHQLPRTFPLVGKSTCDCTQQNSVLSDAYEYVVPRNIEMCNISFAEAYANCACLGNCTIDNPNGGSHYMVRFPGKRPWPLDINHTVIIDRILKELEPITGYPLPAIKYALKNGKIPAKQLKLNR